MRETCVVLLKIMIIVYFFLFQSSFLAGRPSDIFVYPQHPADASQDCYDMPRSLHQTLIRQDSSNYQAPRSHRPPAIQDAAAFADYDVPRPHHNRIQPVRTPSVDSRFVLFHNHETPLFSFELMPPNQGRFSLIVFHYLLKHLVGNCCLICCCRFSFEIQL